MANPKFLNFSTTLISRDGTSATKDARITNILVERKGEGETHYIKRPGYTVYDGTGWTSQPGVGAIPLSGGVIIVLSGTTTGTNNITVNFTADQSGPTNATLNPSDKSSLVTLSNGNLTGTADGTLVHQLARTTVYVNEGSGPRYCEFRLTSVPSDMFLGLANSSQALNAALGATVNGYSYRQSDGKKYNNGSLVAYGATYTNGDVISLLLYAGTLIFWKNGVTQGTAYTGITGNFTPTIDLYGNGSVIANYGASAWAYTPPGGYVGYGS